MIEMSDETIQYLKKLASRKAWSDDGDFDIDGYSGGQTDDAYDGGYDDGVTSLARSILKDLKVEI